MTRLQFAQLPFQYARAPSFFAMSTKVPTMPMCKCWRVLTWNKIFTRSMGATKVLATAPAMPPDTMFLMEEPFFCELAGAASAAADDTISRAPNEMQCRRL